MLGFIIQKIIKKKWLMLALLVGNILLVGITVSKPLYTQAISQRTLMQSFSDYLIKNNAYPGLVAVTARANGAQYHEIIEKSERVRKIIPERMGTGVLCEVSRYSINDAELLPDLKRDDDHDRKRAELSTMSDLDDHIRITAGRIFEREPDANGIIDVIVSESGLLQMNLLLDEIITVPKFKDSDGKPLRIRIAGVFTNSDQNDIYWVRPPHSYTGQLFMAEPLFMEMFASKADESYYLAGAWYTILDYTAIKTVDVENMLAASKEFDKMFSLSFSDTYSDNFSHILSDFIAEEKKFSVTLWVLQIPVYVLLTAFLFMVSRQTLETEQNEISVLKSRGASRRQLIAIYLAQSAVMAAAGLLLGVPFGIFLCQVLGSSNAFLEFVRRQALDIRPDWETLFYALAATAVSIAAMVLPVIKFSGVTIVAHKRRRGSSSPWWRKMFLDVALLGVSLYGLYTFGLQKDLIAKRAAEGAALDPLLFLSSSLFMFGAGLVALRVLPFITWLVYRTLKHRWSPALTASFLYIIRASASRGFITVFLVLTIAMGVFNARAVRTINSDREEHIRYTVGADVAVQEAWRDNRSAVASNPGLRLVYFEPDFGRYQSLTESGAASITKVLAQDDAALSLNVGKLHNVYVMGIHTKEFGETAWFRNSLLPRHINWYLNLISQDARAVLVSRNLQTDYGFEIGDVITYSNSDENMAQGVICEFVDYWPSYTPTKTVIGEDGKHFETPQYLVVAHLSALQSAWGVTPYQVWMKIPGSSQIVYDFAGRTGIQFKKFEDASSLLIALKNDPIFQGTNGMLTIAFIVTLLLCSAGFLIYWIMSIRSRALQFGIFRAMGMSIGEIITMLINEQIFVSALAVVAGVIIGNLASHLYIPLIQIAYTAVDQALPTAVVAETSDSVRLMLSVGSTMLLCMGILAMIIRNLKITQELKLGED